MNSISDSDVDAGHRHRKLSSAYEYNFVRPTPIYNGMIPQPGVSYVIRANDDSAGDVNGMPFMTVQGDNWRTGHAATQDEVNTKWQFVKGPSDKYNTFVLKNVDSNTYLYIPTEAHTDKVYATSDINQAEEFELIDLGMDSSNPVNGDKYPRLFFIRSTSKDTNLLIKGGRIYNYSRGHDTSRATNWLIYPHVLEGEGVYEHYGTHHNTYFIKPYQTNDMFLMADKESGYTRGPMHYQTFLNGYERWIFHDKTSSYSDRTHNQVFEVENANGQERRISFDESFYGGMKFNGVSTLTEGDDRTGDFEKTWVDFEFQPEQSSTGYTYHYMKALNVNDDKLYLGRSDDGKNEVTKYADARQETKFVIFDNKHYAIRNDSRGNTKYIKGQGNENEDIDTQTFVGSDERWYVVPHEYTTSTGTGKGHLIVSFENVEKNMYMKASCDGNSGSQAVVMSHDDTTATQFEMIPVPLEEHTFYLRNRDCTEQFLTKNGSNKVKTHWKNHPYDAKTTSDKPGDNEKWIFEEW